VPIFGVGVSKRNYKSSPILAKEDPSSFFFVKFEGVDTARPPLKKGEGDILSLRRTSHSALVWP